ncbi:MAG: hypothetical protein BKP49_06695 [Treponema sp. CETP13]|nr:MAG: hypothetical protein BKP49_06695 [Treponema sp. CETP13]
MFKEMKQLIENVKQYAMGYESQKRYKHSVRVAKMARKIAKKYSIDADKAYLAGISHDLCKEMSSEAIKNFAKADGLPITAIEEKKPSLLHGRAAAIVVQKFFHIEDFDIIEAIRYHTFGKANMSTLAKIVYISDKIEPKRPQVNKAYYKKLNAMDLDEMALTIVQESIVYLQNKHKNVSDSTLEFLESLKKDTGTDSDKGKLDEQRQIS